MRGVDEDLVEYVVLELGSPQRKVGDAGLLQVGFRLPGDVPGIAGEWFLRVGLDDVAYEACGRNIAERIDESRRNVGYEGEVAELDRFQSGEV